MIQRSILDPKGLTDWNVGSARLAVAAPVGTFVALYVIEGSVVISAWLVLLRLSRRSRQDAQDAATSIARAPSPSLPS